jgi:hypothetical protein
MRMSDVTAVSTLVPNTRENEPHYNISNDGHMDPEVSIIGAGIFVVLAPMDEAIPRLDCVSYGSGRNAARGNCPEGGKYVQLP